MLEFKAATTDLMRALMAERADDVLVGAHR
jgi:hypothetical protein